MARTGRPKAELVLSDVERETLLRWTRRAKTSQALALRARIVLACAEGAENKDVATQVGVWPQTVSKWRGRFVRDRLDGLSDEPRPGAARTITDEQVESVIVKTLEETPTNGDTHWSTRSMARSAGLSQTAVSRIWRAFGLKPHLVDTWKLSKDPQFIEKVRDITGVGDMKAVGRFPNVIRMRNTRSKAREYVSIADREVAATDPVGIIDTTRIWREDPVLTLL